VYDNTWAKDLRTVHHVFIHPQYAGKLKPNPGFHGIYSELEEGKIEDDTNDIKKDMINEDEPSIEKQQNSVNSGFTDAKNPNTRPGYSPLINDCDYDSESESAV
jgi:hypothetical protein